MNFDAILSPYGLAGLVIFTLAVTVVALVRYILKQNDKIEVLNNARLADSEARRIDAITVAQQNTTVLQDVSQNMAILSEKIVIAKSTGRSR
jgi:hypothetical protein